jgi:HNH endonuclease
VNTAPASFKGTRGSGFVPLPIRFWTKVLLSEGTDCWIWQGAKDSLGYGRFGIGNKRMTGPHRYAYERLVGPIPDGRVLDHLCDNPTCVNPAHLRVCTQKENVLRGRSASAINARKKVCKNGHLLSENNVYHPANRPMHRNCRQCLKDACTRQRRRTDAQK